ncbi:MAG: putative oxidoreductase SadH [Actinomycetota bacterium]|jgi:short-subunit dehydrogenase
MRVFNKVAVVTGAGNGMGREMTLQLLSRGAKVFGIDLKSDALIETAAVAGHNPNFKFLAADITDREAVAGLPAAVKAAFGETDLLINNAGIIQPFVKVNDLDLAAADHVMNVNFNGTLNMVKAFLPVLLGRPEAQIANVSSMGGYGPVPGQTVYGASKAAVKLLTEGLRSELLATPVTVTLIYPGAIATNIAANSLPGAPVMTADSAVASKFKMTSAKDAGRMMIDGIEAGKARVFIGSDASGLDKIMRLMPVKGAEIIAKQMKDLLK